MSPPNTSRRAAARTSKRTTQDICLCGCPRHYHRDEDGASPVHKAGVSACMVHQTCVLFIPIGAKS